MFRTARNHPAWRHVLHTELQTAAFWGTFLFLIPWVIVTLEAHWGWPGFAFGGQRVVGALLFAMAGAVGLTSGYIMAVRGRGTPVPMACAQRLVLDGPYGFIRNPMAAAGIVQGFGVGIWLGSWSVLAYALAGAWFWNLILRPPEERYLAAEFGATYERYRANVRCWIPRASRWSDDELTST